MKKRSWLPDMDLNHDKQIQSLLCYRYTIGQAGACRSVNLSPAQSSRQTKGSESRKRVAHGASRGIEQEEFTSPGGATESCPCLSPLWGSGFTTHQTHGSRRGLLAAAAPQLTPVPVPPATPLRTVR